MHEQHEEHEEHEQHDGRVFRLGYWVPIVRVCSEITAAGNLVGNKMDVRDSQMRLIMSWWRGGERGYSVF